MNSLYKQLMASKGAPRVASKENTTQLGTAPMNLRTAMQKYASGGDVKKAKDTKKSSTALSPYNYNVGQNAKLVDIPGVGKVTTYWDEPNKRIIVSDEGYWNPNSPTGERLAKAVKWAHDQGYEAGVVASPFASERFGDETTAGGITRKMPGATDDQLREYINAADFVAVDPYAVHQASATPEVLNDFASFTKNVGDYAKQQGKDSWLVLQGFSPNDVDQSTIADYNNRLIRENAGRYDDLSYFNTTDVGNETNPTETPEGLGVQMDTTKFDEYAKQAAQPYAMAQKANIDLPTDWNNFGATDKIDWLNQHNINSNALAQSGVAQSDIDWMSQNGYRGAQQPVMMTGYDQPPPAQQPNDDFLRQFDDLMKTPTGPQLATVYGNRGSLGNDSPMGPYTPVSPPSRPQDYTPFDDTMSQPSTPMYDPSLMQGSLGNDSPMGPYNASGPATPAAPDYSRAYVALGGADVVNGLRDQFSQMGLDENTIGSIFSKYYGQG